MEKQWIEPRRQSSSDDKQPAPKGLWDDIEAVMRQQDMLASKADASQSLAHSVSLWTRRVAAVAACVALAGGIVVYMEKTENGDNSANGGLPVAQSASSSSSLTDTTSAVTRQSVSSLTAAVVRQRTIAAQEQGSLAAAAVQAAHQSAPTVCQDNLYAAAKRAEKEQLKAEDKVAEVGQHPVKAISQNGKNTDVQAQQPVSNQPTQPHISGNSAAKKSAYSAFSSTGTDRQARLHHAVSRQRTALVSVYGSNLTSIGSFSASGSGDMANAPQSDPVFDNNIVASNNELFTAKNTFNAVSNRVKVKHHQPVKLGLSLHIPLADRWTLESGAFYTNLTTDIESGDKEYGTNIEQKLQYIGVPLKLNYRLWQYSHLSVYAGAGGAAELCVKGTATTQNLNAGQVINESSEDVSETKPQFSVNVSAGIQYSFNRSWGVYAEPGLNYYIDNGSSMKSLYTDKPFNFNLNIGVRWSMK